MKLSPNINTMHMLLTSLKRALPKLNFYPYSFDDVERIAKKERINLTVCEYKPDILGYYCTRKTPKRTKRFIVINSLLDETARTFTGLHELAHHFLHAPSSPKQWFYCRQLAERTLSKHDCEANSVALVAMIPFWKLCELDAAGYQDLSPALLELCVRRKKLWELHDV